MSGTACGIVNLPCYIGSMTTAGAAIAITTSIATVLAILIGACLARCECCCRSCKASPAGCFGTAFSGLAALFATAVFTLTVAGTFTVWTTLSVFGITIYNIFSYQYTTVDGSTINFSASGVGGETMAGLSFLIIAFMFQFVNMLISAARVCRPAGSTSVVWGLAVISAISLTLGVTMTADAAYNLGTASNFFAGLYAMPSAGPGPILTLIALALQYIHLWIVSLAPTDGKAAPAAVAYDAAAPVVPAAAPEPAPAAIAVAPPAEAAAGEPLPAHVQAAAAYK